MPLLNRDKQPSTQQKRQVSKPKPQATDGKVYVGIDPGKEGGLVAILPTGEVIGTPMPETELDTWNWLLLTNTSLLNRVEGLQIGPQVVAAIEKVGGFIQGNPAPGSAMFNFGKSAGTLRMGLTALRAKWEEVTPQAWQKAMGFPVKKGEKPAARKERLRAFAQRLFPELAIWTTPKTVGKQRAICDALIIALYCKRKDEGKLR